MTLRPLLLALLCTTSLLATAAGDFRAYPFISDTRDSPIGPILEPRSETAHRGVRLIMEQRF